MGDEALESDELVVINSVDDDSLLGLERLDKDVAEDGLLWLEGLERLDILTWVLDDDE